MPSYPDRIAEILAHAPPAPPLRRKPVIEARALSEEMKAKLILLHAEATTCDQAPDWRHAA